MVAGGGGGGAGGEFLMKVFKVFSLDRVQQRFVEQMFRLWTSLYPAGRVPAVQRVLLGGASDPVHRQSALTFCVRRRRVPTVQTVQKTIGIPQVLFLGEVVVSVVIQRQVRRSVSAENCGVQQLQCVR